MELEKQVASVELCIRLHELGVIKKTIFVWEYIDKSCYGVRFFPFSAYPNSISIYNQSITYPAFTVSELVKMLPAEIGDPHLEMCKRRGDGYGIEYICMDDCFTHSETFADACAKMLIKLIEKKLIEVPNGSQSI